MLTKFLCFFFVIIFWASSLIACSSIWIRCGEYFILGANLDGEGDWNGLVFINYRNVLKRTDFYNTGRKDKSWISKYGSITFNLACKEYPQYGMNEEGLIVSTVSDPKTKGPLPDKRPSMIGNFWVQYILDVCKNTDEVKKSLKEIRVMPGIDRYVVCDKNKNSIVIEFQNHRVKIYENESLPVNVITNQSYSNCLKHYKQNTLPEQNNIFEYITTKRFLTAVRYIKGLKCTEANQGINLLFNTLKQIEGSPESLWRVVFDQSGAKIYFITKYNREIRYLDFSQLNLICQKSSEMMDIDLNSSGDVSKKFIAYSTDENYKLYKRSMMNLGKKADEAEIKKHIKFLEGFQCK